MSSKSTKDAAVMKIGRDGNVTLSYLLLTKSNYSMWELKMQVNLQVQEVWKVVMLDEIDKRNNRMALAVIYQALPKDVLLMVAQKGFAKIGWETLKTMHVGVERIKEAKVKTLNTQFEVIRMKNGELVDDFATKLTFIVTGIRSLEEKMEEISVIKMFLRALLQIYMQIVTTIEQFGDIKNMTIEEIVGRLTVTRRDFIAKETKRRRTYCSCMMKNITNEEKRKSQFFL
ncbi:uncharacterized protein LOC124939900 [Impatiens glandulifera]|uniref:uncharacterized protein LOC124939900 n=1 Tax=Impatiens glandulifera TaxID=253017 RepID=UPI001FB0CE50|nr:uncharacterized protein LOC124939900 [Impatiens glandulifera]